MTPDISVRREGAVYRIELNRPDCGNLVTAEMVHTLSEAVRRLPEMTKGLPPTLAMAALNKLGARSIAYLVYSTVEIDARSALAMGLVSAVVPDGELETKAAKLVETISSQPLDAVKAVKEYLKFAPQMEPRGRADFAASLIAGVLSSR